MIYILAIIYGFMLLCAFCWVFDFSDFQTIPQQMVWKSEKSKRLDILEARIKAQEAITRAILSREQSNAKEAPEPAKVKPRQRIVARSMSEYKQAMGEEEIHVP